MAQAASVDDLRNEALSGILQATFTRRWFNPAMAGMRGYIRRERRRRLSVPAVISYGENKELTVPCEIRDASRAGAKISCRQLRELPDEIRVTTARLSGFVDAKIIWRRGETAGVQLFWKERHFLSALADKSRTPATGPTCPACGGVLLKLERSRGRYSCGNCGSGFKLMSTRPGQEGRGRAPRAKARPRPANPDGAGLAANWKTMAAVVSCLCLAAGLALYQF